MRSILAFLLLLTGNLLSSRAQTADAQPARWIIGLSPHLPNEAKNDVFRRIAALILEDAPLDSSIWIYDALRVQTVAQFEIPNVRAFRSPKTRANQFRVPFQQLREFLAREPEAAPNHPAAIHLPRFAAFVADHHAARRENVVVILLGSPLHMDSKEPSFSMANGYFPSDGHLSVGREQSVYGIEGRAEALKNALFYFGYFADPWISNLHEEKVARFWNLYLQGQGARLVSFTGDLPTVFNAARGANSADQSTVSAQSPSQNPPPSPGANRVEMLRITRDIAATDWIARDELSNAAVSPPSSNIGPMKIGIRWQGNMDLDLYATPRPGAPTLFFQNIRSPEGYYFKDHRSSPDREFEFIEFEQPIDFRDVKAFINFHTGEAPNGPSGEIRVEFENRIYSAPFRIRARTGNEGRTGPGQEEFWTEIPLAKLLSNLNARDTSVDL
jgi:hypothetical protein